MNDNQQIDNKHGKAISKAQIEFNSYYFLHMYFLLSYYIRKRELYVCMYVLLYKVTKNNFFTIIKNIYRFHDKNSE